MGGDCIRKVTPFPSVSSEFCVHFTEQDCVTRLRCHGVWEDKCFQLDSLLHLQKVRVLLTREE